MLPDLLKSVAEGGVILDIQIRVFGLGKRDILDSITKVFGLGLGDILGLKSTYVPVTQRQGQRDRRGGKSKQR